jgi:uncharacterized protein YlxW (UPF0749 family)
VHIDNPFTMVVMIVLITAIAGVFRARYGVPKGKHARDYALRSVEGEAETHRLRDEVKQLKDRIAVLERITVEKENSLERQIESLRDR